MFCKKPVGSNEVVESFPIGRRLAFDAAKGRLGVVCTTCQRWNLTPQEERWKPVEDCERIFRETPMRASTENIGIARHREGLDLARIGESGLVSLPVAVASVVGFGAWGGSRFSVQRAVHEIESEGHPSRFVAHVAGLGYRTGGAVRGI